MTIEIRSLAELPNAALDFIERVGHRKVFAFQAEMGAGKTTFIMALLKAMGIEDPDGSPTYSLVNSYDSPMYGRIYHFDFYRIDDIEEAFDIGVEEMLYDDAICFIEWPEKIPHLLPVDTCHVFIEITSPETRRIRIGDK